MGFKAPKPRVLVDIQTPRLNVFSSLTRRQNLSFAKTAVIPLNRITKAVFLSAAGLYLLFGSVAAPVITTHSFAAQISDAERQQLEQQLAELEKQISEYEDTIDQYRRAGKSLQGEIDSLNAKINKLNLQIKAINLSLEKLDREIGDTKSQIQTAEDKLDLHREALGRSIQRLYENEQTNLVALLLKNPRLSDFFGDMNNLLEVQNSFTITVNQVVELRNDLMDKKEILAVKRADTASLKEYQDAQKASLSSVKRAKADLLQTTKGQESKYQDLLKETRKTAAQIRSRIFELIGGGELTFEDAYKFAKFAEDATGVRAAVILAVLDKESALGQNVGRCPYYDAVKDRYYMNPTRDVPIFLDIVKALKEAGTAPPEPILISCPNRDGSYGGAMGSAQFIPSTWAIYQARIAEITGSNPPSPWRNADAFVGTALYLKDAGAAKATLNEERVAAARYYAGSRWRSYLWTYGDRVVTKAQEFQKDIDILNS